MTTFETYGAVGDGVTNDRDAVYNALNSGDTIIARTGAIYYIGSSITITGKDITVSGRATFLFKDTSKITLSGTAGVSTVLSADSVINDSYFTVANPAGFAIGDLISVTTSQANSWHIDIGYRNGELHEITGISGNRLYIADKVWTNWVVGVFTLKVVQFKPISVSLTGLTFMYSPAQAVSGGLTIQYAKNNILDEVAMLEAKNIGIMIHYCYNTIFRNGSVSGTNSNAGGYGLRFQGSNISEVDNSEFYRNIKSIESSSSPPTAYDYGQFPNRSLTVKNSYGCGCGLEAGGDTLFVFGSCFVHTHAASQNLIVHNNEIDNCYSPFLDVGIDSEFYDNTITGQTMHCCMFVFGANHKVKRNTANGILGQQSGAGGSFVLAEDLYFDNYLEVEDNVATGLQKFFIAAGGTLNINNATVINNTGNFSDNPGYFYHIKTRFVGVIESGNVWNGLDVHEHD